MNNYNKKLGNQNAVNSPNDFKNDKEKNENYFINVGLKYPNWQLVKNTIYKS